MKSEFPVLWEQTKMEKFLNLFVCLYRYLSEKSFWPRNYAAYAEVPSLYLKDREKQTPTHKVWYTGNFTGAILDHERKEPYLMSKRRAERVVSTFSRGVVIKYTPDPIWFSVAYFIFFSLLPLPFSAYLYFRKVLSGPINRLNYSLQVEWSKGANLQKEGPVLRGAEIIQDHIHLFYDRPLYSKGDGFGNEPIAGTSIKCSAYMATYSASNPLITFSDKSYSVALSNHADFRETLEYVEVTGAEIVVTDNTRNHGIELANAINERLSGIRARPSTNNPAPRWR